MGEASPTLTTTSSAMRAALFAIQLAVSACAFAPTTVTGVQRFMPRVRPSSKSAVVARGVANHLGAKFAEGTISCAQSVAIVTPNATATAMDHQLLKRLKRRTTTAVASIAALPAPLLLSMTIALEILATTSMKFAEANARWYLGVFGG